MARTWFISGASKGFGREWREAALGRGDNVAATARRIDTLEELVDMHGEDLLRQDATRGSDQGLRVATCDVERMAARLGRGGRVRVQGPVRNDRLERA